MSNSISLIDSEGFISKRARSLANCHYAFSVVLSNVMYRELRDLFKKKNIYLPDDIVKYPWCHLKLITETYVRVFDGYSDDRGMISLLEKEIGENFRDYWEAIPGILERLNLKRVREEKGPWYIYANVTLHAGIPSAYFNKLFDTAKETYKGCNEDTNRTIEELCEKRDIFKYSRFSKYFERAFQSPTEKKLLFKWLVNLVGLKHWGDHFNRQLFDYLPGHLLNCLETIKIDTGGKRSIISDKIRKEKEESIEKCLVFNPDKNRVEYRIPIKEFDWEGRKKDDISDNWKTALDMAKLKRSPYVHVPVAPGDLLKGITLMGYQLPVFENIPGHSIETIIFDFNYKAMIPATKDISISKENQSLLTIISRNELPGLKKTLGWSFHEDLTGEWWDWYHYEWKVSPTIETVNFPPPYGEIVVRSGYEQCNISGEWLSDVQLPKLSQNFKQFGGDKPPVLKISLSRENKPLISAQFSNGNRVLDDKAGRLHYKDDSWIWTSSLNVDTLTASQYNINVSVYLMVPGESECALFDCVWYPSLEVSVHPGSLLWPDDSCTIRMRTNENFIIHTDISDNDVKESLNGNEYLWEFTGKPSDCSPVITLSSEKYSFDFVLRLPYLSAWVVTPQAHQFEAIQLEWKNSRPFARSVLEQVVEKDYNARIRFRLYSKECKFLSIYENTTNQLIRTLSFEEDGHDSISCSEILKWDIPVIRKKISGKKAYLIELDEKKWSFYEIFERAKKASLYKNRFYYGNKKSEEKICETGGLNDRKFKS